MLTAGDLQHPDPTAGLLVPRNTDSEIRKLVTHKPHASLLHAQQPGPIDLDLEIGPCLMVVNQFCDWRGSSIVKNSAKGI